MGRPRRIISDAFIIALRQEMYPQNVLHNVLVKYSLIRGILMVVGRLKIAKVGHGQRKINRLAPENNHLSLI